MDTLQKTAIIGGGICGLYLAWKLSQEGHRVVVFERKKEIGKQVCSGLFSERILNFIPESRTLIDNEISSAFLHFPKRTVRLDFSKKFLVMSHYKLDRLTASLAGKQGAEIVLGKGINALPEGFSRIIGCDGALSFIRQNLHLAEPRFKLGIQAFVEKPDSSDFVDVWPTRKGFIWKIPRGQKIEYGIIEEKARAKEIFDSFLEEKAITVRKKRAALIPQGFIIPSLRDITLCGDAAGLTKPWSGGGVIWGLKAADILIDNFPDFLEYKKAVRNSFLPKIIFSKIATELVHFAGFAPFFLLPKSVKIENDFLI